MGGLNQFNVSLWGDEAFSAVLSMNPVMKILEIISRDTSPPLYNITLHFWYQAFGTSEVAIRTLSFTYFLMAIFFTYKIGALLWGRRIGLLAAVLTFLNPFFFIYAFEGRMYSILAMGVAASMYFFLKILRENEDKKTKTNFWLIPTYSIATAVALYSHHFAIFAVAVQFAWFAFEFLFGHRQAAKRIFKGLVLTGLLYLPWLYPLFKQTTMVAGGFWLGTPTLTDLRNLIYKYLAEGINNPTIKVPFLSLSLSQLSLYFVFATLLIRKWHKSVKKTLILLTWFTTPILTTWLISQKMQSIFFDRYLLYTIPAAMLILVSNGRKFTVVISGILVLMFLVIDSNYFIHPAKRPFRDLANYVKQVKQPEDYLINWNSKAHHLWESKYYGIPAPIYNPGEELPFYVGTAQMTDKDIIKSIPDKDRVGVITSGPVEEVIIPEYVKESAKQFGELKYVLLTKPLQ